jgi:hypothetical protein
MSDNHDQPIREAPGLLALPRLSKEGSELENGHREEKGRNEITMGKLQKLRQVFRLSGDAIID